MSLLLAHKVVSSLPGTLAASSVYFVRVGSGVDVYVTNETGTVVAYPTNSAKSGANSDITSLRASQYVDKAYVNSAATGTVTLDLSLYSIFDLTLTGNTTLALSNFPTLSGESLTFVIRLTCGATPYNISWFSGITWLTAGSTIPIAPAASKVAEFIITSQNGSTYLGRKGPYN